MIISPPFLPARDAAQTDDRWLASAMPAVAARGQDTRAPEGSFPLSFNFMWHNGMHLQAPVGSNGANPSVRAVADGTVIFVSPTPTKQTDNVEHAQNYNPFTPNGAEKTAAWTDNGCVIIKHATTIGANAAAETAVEFYSLYMHLSVIGKTTPAGQTAQRVWTAGDAVWRKDEIGTPGQVYGHSGQIHFEICCDATNLQRLIGREPNWIDPVVAPATLPVPTADGRTDSLFGSMYFYLPANTPTDEGVAQPSNHLRRAVSGNNTGTTLQAALWVKMTYDRGACSFETFSAQGAAIGAARTQANEEYDLYKEATDRHNALPAAAKALSSPSAWYELLRFGRNIGRGPADADKDPLPSTPTATAAHWRRINGPNETALWADLNAAGSFKFSDADFPALMGWNCIGDDTTPNDQRCDSEHLKALIAEPDVSVVNRMDVEVLTARLGRPDVQQKLKRTICKFPSEWDQSSITTRYAFVKDMPAFKEAPEAWAPLEAHLKALTFTGLPAEYLAADWRFDPREIVGHLRKCGWLSARELLQLVPQNVIRKPGSHNSSTQGHWESPSLTAAKNLLGHHAIALSRALRKFCVNSPIRQACFFGNSTQETAWFRLLRESDGSQPNLHLGWYGRGFLQLTNPDGAINGGNNNYYKYFRFIGREPRDPPSAIEITWRDQVGTDAHHAAQSAAAYWAWPNKSVPTTSNPNRPQVDNANRYADVLAVNQRRVIATASGSKVWYYNQSFTDCAAAVNYPATVGQSPPNMNGLVDRSTAFVNALVVLTDSPKYLDIEGQEKSTPENFARRIFT
jgi:hypothetical protein